MQRNRGLTLIEISVATSVLVVGLISLGGVMVSLSHQRDQVEVKHLVLGRAKSLLEEIKGTAPESIVLTYDGKTYSVNGVAGASLDGTALTVSVDSTNPMLIAVSIRGAWMVGGASEDLELYTEIFSPTGQQ